MGCRSIRTATRQRRRMADQSACRPAPAWSSSLPAARGRPPCSSRAPSIPDRAARTTRIGHWHDLGSPDAPSRQLESARRARAAASAGVPWLGDVAPVRVRKLYFSEKLANPADPNSATEFYITVDGRDTQALRSRGSRPTSSLPGHVEDWIIENRSNELHAFHIHQLHFVLVDWPGVPVQRAVPAGYRQRAVFQRATRSTIRACGCAWTSVIPTSSVPSSITVICWSIRTAE